MDVDRYLKRIKYQGSIKPDLSTLKELQNHHLLHIPFENLDIHWGIYKRNNGNVNEIC